MSTCGCTEFTIAEGATRPLLTNTLTDPATGAVIDLTGATLAFVAVHRLYGVRVTKTPVSAAPTTGVLVTTFAATDLQAGVWDYQYTVTISGAITRYPDASYYTMSVTPAL